MIIETSTHKNKRLHAFFPCGSISSKQYVYHSLIHSLSHTLNFPSKSFAWHAEFAGHTVYASHEGHKSNIRHETFIHYESNEKY